jgi:hypothetical protein
MIPDTIVDIAVINAISSLLRVITNNSPYNFQTLICILEELWVGGWLLVDWVPS